MAQQPRRVMLLEWKVPPQSAHKLLEHAREFVTNNVDAEFNHVKNKRPRDPKAQLDRRRAIEGLKIIASFYGKGSTEYMRKIARETLKDII